MGKITREIKNIIHEEHLGFVATASLEGVPNVSPKGSIRVWDDDTLIFIDIASVHTRQNLLENPHVSVNILSFKNYVGYQIQGQAEVLGHGFIYDSLVSEMNKIEPKLSEQIFVVKISVEQVQKQTAPPLVKKLSRQPS